MKKRKESKRNGKGRRGDKSAKVGREEINCTKEGKSYGRQEDEKSLKRGRR
jgi:hypothetical protein